MVVTRSRKSVAEASSCAGRKRKAATAPADDSPSKKRRMGQSDSNADQGYLQNTVSELRKLRCAKHSDRKDAVRLALRYIAHFQLPNQQNDSRTRPDGYFFDSPSEASRFLASNKAIDAPVFVHNGCNFSSIDPDSDRRPIDQLFDLCPNKKERLSYVDVSESGPNNDKVVTISEGQQRFQKHNGFAKYPRNFPDILDALLDHGIPSFVRNAQCTLLHSIIRTVLDVYGDNGVDLCDCPELSCDHNMSQDELAPLREACRHWRGTTMLAELGAITLPHWDKYGFGTWISCVEGEIGFSWLSHPTKIEHVQWHERQDKVVGSWFCKILRPGDALYMPPGTVHFVFRRPNGQQTLGFGGHVLRWSDLSKWLHVLSRELDLAATEEDNDIPYWQVLRPILKNLKGLIKSAALTGDDELFGAKFVVRDVLKALKKVEKQLTAFEVRAK